MELLQIIILASLAEATWETLKMTWANGKVSFDKIGVIAMGIAFSYTFKADLFLMFKLAEATTILGMVATGILVSRGANFIHDLYKSVQGFGTNEIVMAKSELE